MNDNAFDASCSCFNLMLIWFSLIYFIKIGSVVSVQDDFCSLIGKFGQVSKSHRGGSLLLGLSCLDNNLQIKYKY